MEQIYAFFCSRYGNLKYDELLNMGYEEFSAKLSSIPEDEPIYKIFKSRSIEVNKIKDKEERKYWVEMKQVNRIPDIYLSTNEVDNILRNKVRGFKDGERLNKV